MAHLFAQGRCSPTLLRSQNSKLIKRLVKVTEKTKKNIKAIRTYARCVSHYWKTNQIRPDTVIVRQLCG